MFCRMILNAKNTSLGRLLRMRRANLEAKKLVELTMENGRTLTLTSDHPVYSRDRQAWIDAGEIKADEDIESPIM